MGMYLTPWLWFDGNQHGGFDYTQWEPMIVARMSQPSPVTITMWGDYNAGNGTGTINARFQNDSSATINGRVLFVITEDSIYYDAPNGVQWHSHVPKIYLPDYNGETVSIPSGGFVTLTRPFTIQPEWDEDYCKILTWIQDDNMQPDSTKEIWQGGMKRVKDLSIEEENLEQSVIDKVILMPNPCVDGTSFSFNLPEGMQYRIAIFDVAGRCVSRLEGESSGKQESIMWRCKDGAGSLISSGVYFYCFESDDFSVTGKVVVR